MTTYRCPGCDEQGEHIEEDQARCTVPACRVTTFQTTFPPDAVLEYRHGPTDAERAANRERRRRENLGVETRSSRR